MARKPARDLEEAIVEAAMALFAERGYAGTRLIDIAERAGCDLGVLRARLDDKLDILPMFLRRIDGAVLAEDAGFGPEESVRDRLFDLLIRRFDALKPYRPALQSVLRDLRGDLPALLSLAPKGVGALGWYLEAAGTSTDGLAGMARIKGLSLVWLHCLRIWFQDDSEDLARTMSALDKALIQAERAAGWMQKGARRRPDPTGTDAGFTEPTNGDAASASPDP